MPKFDVIIQHRLFENLTVEVDAPTAAEAEEKVQKVVEMCTYEADAIAAYYREAWETEDEDLTVEGVEQV